MLTENNLLVLIIKKPLPKNLTPAGATILLKTFISTTLARATIFEFSTKKVCSKQTMNALKQP